MNILSRDIAQVNVVDLGAVVHIIGHAWPCSYIIQFQFGMRRKFYAVAGFPREFIDPLLFQAGEPLRVIDPDFFNNLKEPGTAGDPDCLE